MGLETETLLEAEGLKMMTNLKRKKLKAQPLIKPSKCTQLIPVLYPELVNTNPEDLHYNALQVSLTDATGITNKINL